MACSKFISDLKLMSKNRDFCNFFQKKSVAMSEIRPRALMVHFHAASFQILKDYKIAVPTRPNNLNYLEGLLNSQ